MGLVVAGPIMLGSLLALPFFQKLFDEGICRLRRMLESMRFWSVTDLRNQSRVSGYTTVHVQWNPQNLLLILPAPMLIMELSPSVILAGLTSIQPRLSEFSPQYNNRNPTP